ncbi:amidase [Pollutimonas bauzanensis]|uniref:Asp-tRNAAsn/Glu-tRNAGln amidotransferase A subunit n=1 Tax=Pollutimonas bauzanensis TaxID=658167 RepID=A0A1M5VLH4_9BURK|nr:amidase [Pollutimonas bauzanensis]SHH75904.1 Asp-tRNAAsn/Glu-tRNAGln amidotransferase A subunit [Pollutimonas bauzanensis]
MPWQWESADNNSFHRVAADFRKGKNTPRQYLECFLENIARYEGNVKAFTALNIDNARQLADDSTRRYQSGKALSELDGCPFGIKDIIDTADFPTECGSPIFKGSPANFDAACVEVLKRAGAIIVGKTVTTEFAIGVSGVTHNPHRLGHTPGGSSSGSAAAVAASMLPVALGTQTLGSIIRPASFCGIVGFKPSYGVLPLGGVHPVSGSHDHLGILSANIDDAWLTARLLSSRSGSPNFPPLLPGPQASGFGPDRPPRLIRLYLDAWLSETSTPLREAMDLYIDQLREQGISIADKNNTREIAELEDAISKFSPDSREMIAYDMRWPYMQYRSRYPGMLSDKIMELLELSESVTSEAYAGYLSNRKKIRDLVRTAVGNADGFITLSAPTPAPPGLEFTGSRNYAALWSLLGFPAFSLPILKTDDLPVGVQIMHVDNHDAVLYELASWLMKTRHASA